jgi:Protein of unknown function (DUF1203)
MRFRISGLPAARFAPLFALSDAELSAQGVRRCAASLGSRRPCRVSLHYTPLDETALLLAYEHLPAPASPFRASGPIYVREGLRETFDRDGEIPPVLAEASALSLRAYDGEAMMVDAEIVPGMAAEAAILRLLERPDAAYLHAHFAPRGCYLARIDRA